MSFIIHTEAFNDHKTDLFNATHFQQERRFVWKENSSFSLPSRWIIQFMLCVRQLKVHLCLFFSHMYAHYRRSIYHNFTHLANDKEWCPDFNLINTICHMRLANVDM